MERVSGDSGAIASSTNSYGTGHGEGVVVQRAESRIATGFRHTSDESRSVYFCFNK